jgi:hypothetical protein
VGEGTASANVVGSVLRAAPIGAWCGMKTRPDGRHAWLVVLFIDFHVLALPGSSHDHDDAYIIYLCYVLMNLRAYSYMASVIDLTVAPSMSRL